MQTISTADASGPAMRDGRLAIEAPLAPWWHTLLLVAFVFATSWFTAHTLKSGTPLHGSKSGRFISTMVMQWVMLLYVVWGVRMRGRGLRDVIGKTWKSMEDVLIDLAIAVVFLIAAWAVLFALQYALHMVNQTTASERVKSLAFMTPDNAKELALYICMAWTAGFCEETIFRGYLQRQFISWTRNAAAGIILSGICFGLAHAYQGKMMLVLGCYGMLFGVLAYFRRSLIPGMIAHGSQDTLSGLALMFAKHMPIK